MVRVRPDVPAIDKEFDYFVPPSMTDSLTVGSMVRIGLHGRRVGGWVVGIGVDPEPGVELRPLAKVSGWGPSEEIIELARWAAWRWAGRTASLLRTASPATVVRALPRNPPRDRRTSTPTPVPVASEGLLAAVSDALGVDAAVLRLPPADDPHPVLVAAAGRGPLLVVGPDVATIRRLAMRLRRSGLAVALQPEQWAAARAGGTSVMGTRSAAWAPAGELGAIVLLDEHDESLQQEQAPTWHAREVLRERARRAGVPFLMISATPSLEALACSRLVTIPRAQERAGWPVVEIVDRRAAPPGEGLFSPRFVELARAGGRILCVLNRKGRARLSACGACGVIAACERCDAAAILDEEDRLSCTRCGTTRPVVCTACGSVRLRTLRAGVTKVREELERLLREPVAELTAETEAVVGGVDARVVVGTESALHRLDGVTVVAFLDFDQELLAPRYRAAEQALALLGRAARLVGGRPGPGRLLVQTRLPDHEVLRAAVSADPTKVSAVEWERRRSLGFPPHRAIASVSGPVAAQWIDALGRPEGVEVLGPADGRWLLRAVDHAVLCDVLASVPRPSGRMRIEVDPLRI